MRKKYLTAGLVSAMIITSLAACGEEANNSMGSSGGNNSSGTVSSEVPTAEKFDIQIETDEENEKSVVVKDGENTTELETEADVVLESENDNTIYLNGSSVKTSSSGVNVDGNTVTIKNAGTYIVTGKLDDGQIIVDTEDKETVWIVLNNAEITSTKNAAIYVVNAKKTIISASSGTKNILTDAKDYTYAVAEDEEPNACIFSKDDLVLSGDGELVVNGNFNNGIASKDTLEINNIKLTVKAENNGIKGKDYLVIKNADISVESAGDGLKSDNTEDTTLGYIYVENTSLNIESGEDGIQAETCLEINGGSINIKTGEGSGTTSVNDWWGGGNTSSDTSIKGIKAGVSVDITDGNITIDSEDDAIHTNDSVSIEGGNIEISSGDDGIHADTTLEITGGTIKVTKSYEGLEATNIVVKGGDISVKASDDGINAAGGNDSSASEMRPGMNNFSGSTGTVVITGGKVYMDADGDGLDSNGNISMSGGEVYVDGPTNSGNGAMDYDSTFTMTGGILVAAGSSGMMQTVSNTSTQYCIAVVTSDYAEAGEEVVLQDSEGNKVFSYSPSKTFNSIVICTPEIEQGETYTATIGGESAGTVEVSSVVNYIGSNAGGFGGGQPGGQQGGQPGGQPGGMGGPGRW